MPEGAATRCRETGNGVLIFRNPATSIAANGKSFEKRAERKRYTHCTTLQAGLDMRSALLNARDRLGEWRWFMVSRATVALVLLVGALVPATVATSGDRAPGHQSAIVGFEHPTWVAGEMLIGTYVIVHDEDKMTRGEPCTALYRVGARTRPLEEVVSFHCIPRERKVVSRFTTTVSSDPVLGMDTLTEYQFAGDAEGHGVPTAALASVGLRVPESVVCAR